MITIAITGGIGSGKSTVTNYLISMGFIVVDADKIAREMTSSGGEAIPYIVKHFGSSYILEDGSMDREAIRDLVYNDSEAMKVLEKGTTYAVLEKIKRIERKASNEGYKAVFFDIPLLFEKNQQDNYDMVWVVTADYNNRSQRVMIRDGIDENTIVKIMQAQEDDRVKIENADLVIDNNGSLEDLYAKVNEALINCSLL